jgi:hypothetical protein
MYWYWMYAAVQAQELGLLMTSVGAAAAAAAGGGVAGMTVAGGCWELLRVGHQGCW